MNYQDSKQYEIMAPVGSYESLAAAIEAGADSVYFGVGRLNMRSHSANHFDIGDLRQIVAICTEHGIKTYLTVNTIIYDNDLATMREILDAAREAGVSAIIASDVAVMSYCRQIGLEVHLSTQLNISNVEALRFYAQFADVAVLARELNMDQVSHIYEAIHGPEPILGPAGQPVRIEMFCHGALCMAVSGKCYMSLMAQDRSANRGECVQICRRSYLLTDRETGNAIEADHEYLMSPKDLKTIRFIDKMMKARSGVCAQRGALLQGGDTERARRHLYRGEEGRLGRAPGRGLQPWLLGRLLPGTQDGRVEQALWFHGHGAEGLGGQADQLFLPYRRG